MSGANEVRIPFTVTGEDEAVRDIKKVEHAAEKAGDAIEDMGGQATIAAKASDKAGDSLGATAGKAGHLAAQAAAASENIKRLVLELDKGGDKSIKKDIRSEKRSRSEALNLLKEIAPDPADAAATGVDLGQKIIGGITSAVKGGPGGAAGAAAITSLAVLAAPGIATAVGAAVLGGVGLGGIIGGVALAAQDQRVKSAGEQLGQSLLGDFTKSAKPFVDPVLDALGMLRTAGSGLAAGLEPAFDRLSAKVGPLTEGLIGAAERALPGFVKGLDAAGPTIDALARNLPELGEEVGDFFANLDPEAAAIFMDEFLEATKDAIEFGGEFVGTLMDVYSGAHDVADALGLLEPRILGWKKGAQEGEAANKGFALSTAEAAEEARGLQVAIDELFGRTMNAKEANLAYEQSIDDLVGQLKDGKRTLDDNTQAGRDNWTAINDTAKAIDELRDANLRNKMPLSEANALYEKQFDDLQKTLLGLGYNKTAVKDYIAELKKIPATAKTTIYIEARASKGLNAILAGVASVDGARAGGGPTKARHRYLVGEDGPEILEMGDADGHVYTAGQTRAMMSGASGGAAAAAPTGGGQWVATVRAKDNASQWLADLVEVTVERVLDAEASAIAGGVRT